MSGFKEATKGMQEGLKLVFHSEPHDPQDKARQADIMREIIRDISLQKVSIAYRKKRVKEENNFPKHLEDWVWWMDFYKRIRTRADYYKRKRGKRLKV